MSSELPCYICMLPSSCPYLLCLYLFLESRPDIDQLLYVKIHGGEKGTCICPCCGFRELCYFREIHWNSHCCLFPLYIAVTKLIFIWFYPTDVSSVRFEFGYISQYLWAVSVHFLFCVLVWRVFFLQKESVVFCDLFTQNILIYKKA